MQLRSYVLDSDGQTIALSLLLNSNDHFMVHQLYEVVSEVCSLQAIRYAKGGVGVLPRERTYTSSTYKDGSLWRCWATNFKDNNLKALLNHHVLYWTTFAERIAPLCVARTFHSNRFVQPSMHLLRISHQHTNTFRYCILAFLVPHLHPWLQTFTLRTNRQRTD